jgi:signal transduction histidine kinase/DNA-binding NarL/FixJ family response regulator
VKLKGQIAVFLAFVSALVIGAVAFSFVLGVKRIEQEHQGLARQMGMAFFEQLVIARRWVARHNGVYVKVSDAVRPNPYLDDPERDLVTTDGTSLTKVNPAYMTRMLSEMAATQDGIQFKITSLQPMNPHNAPDAWEREALVAFESGASDHSGLIVEQGREAFRFMGALITEEPCLTCHAKDGYVLGSVRGGIRVSVPYEPFRSGTEAEVARFRDGHLSFLFAVLSLIWVAGWMLRRQAARVDVLNADMRALNSELQSKNDAIACQNLSLDQALIEAKCASRAKNAFLANMSHEIRTPMNALVGFVDFLSRTPLNPEQSVALLRMRDSSRALLEMIDDVLDYADLEAGRMTLDPRPFELQGLVDAIEARFGTAISGRDLALRCRIGPSVPAVLIGDPHRLDRVLSHLVGNAVKFTERGRVDLSILRIGIEGASVRLRFEVRDTGIGIDQGHLDLLFQPFVQADSSSTRPYEGIGLGLVISRACVERMGGVLTVESTVNEGSVFRFDLAMQVASARDQGHSESGRRLPSEARGTDTSDSGKAVAPDFRGLTILVVEDNLLNQEVAKRMLAKTGAAIAIANHGAEALDLVAIRRFDLVLMDLQMPVMDGFEATRRLRERFPDLPVIALTAAVMEDDRARARAAGVNAHLAKPIDMRVLFETLSFWLSDRPQAFASGAIAPDTPSTVPSTPDTRTSSRFDPGRPEVPGSVERIAGAAADGLRPRLLELWTLLDANNLRALDVFVELQRSLPPSAAIEVERLAEQISRLDFAAARACLSELLARLPD